MHRGISWAGCLLAFTVCLPSSARAQQAEHHHVEHLTASEVGPFEPVKSPHLREVEQEIFKKTNAFRQDEGRQKVDIDETLNKTATQFANYMARTDRYGHYAEGKGPAKRAEEQGYDYCVIAENIAYEFKTKGFKTDKLAEGFVTGWKNSPPHRRNMLKRSVTETGVAVAQSHKTGVFYAVQIFGRPKSAKIEFRITNKSDVTFHYALGDRQYELPPNYARTHTICEPSKLRWQPGLKSSEAKSKSQELTPENGAEYSVGVENDQVLLERSQSAGSAGSR